MKKKTLLITVFMLALLAAFGLAACGPADTGDDGGGDELLDAVITVTELEHTYSREPKAVSVSVEPADAGTVTVTYKRSGSVVASPVNAGTYDVTVAFTSGTHKAQTLTKQLVISQCELTVSGTVAQNKVYDGNETVSFSANGTLSGVLSGDTVTLARIIAETADKSAGTAKPVIFSRFVLGGSEAANYTVKSPENVTVNITKKALTLGGVTITPKNYDGNVSASYTGDPILVGVEGDDIVGIDITRFEYQSADSGRDKPMRLYAALTGADSGNYSISSYDSGVTGIIGIVHGDYLLAEIKTGSTVTAYSVLAYLGSSVTITIPSSYNPGSGAKNITTIDKYAFSEDTLVKTVTFPSAITKIDEYAFNMSAVETVTFSADSNLASIEYCAFFKSAITAIEIPSKVTAIRGDAFKESALASLTFAARAGNTPNLSIKERVFFGTNLVNVTIPGYVNELGFGCFQLCMSLKSAVFKNDKNDISFGNAPDGRAWTFAWSSVESITFETGTGAIKSIPKTFAQETPLHTIVLSEGITKIGFCAFIFTNVTSVNIPSTVTRIEEGAFKSIAQLKTLTFSPGGTQALVIEEFVFYQTALTSVAFPARLRYLGWGTVAEIPTLGSVTFEEGYGSIQLIVGDDAFNLCPLLTTVTLPNSILAYANNAFYNAAVVNGQGKGRDPKDAIFQVPA